MAKALTALRLGLVALLCTAGCSSPAATTTTPQSKTDTAASDGDASTTETSAGQDTAAEVGPAGDTAASETAQADAVQADTAQPDSAPADEDSPDSAADAPSDTATGCPGGCPDDNPKDCVVPKCDLASGTCVAKLLDSGPCDDGIACTLGEACSAGKCVPDAVLCQCLTAADCAGKVDLCAGEPVCDLPAGTCSTKPGTKVVCPKPINGGCTTFECEPLTGKCEPQPVLTVPFACDDGDACTAGDHCDAGKCVGSAFVCQCSKDSDCADKEDGNLCNGTLVCKNNACVVDPSTVVTCNQPDGNPCLTSLCDPKSGLCSTYYSEFVGKACPTNQPDCGATVIASAPLVIVCDDGNPCTASTMCEAGKCKADAVANICPACTKDADCAASDDGNPCNGKLYCDPNGQCSVDPATVVVCPAGSDPCSTQVCSPTSGKCEAKTAATGTVCSDGDPCTTGDACAAGKCVGGANKCPCATLGDCAVWDDGNACNGTLVCKAASGKSFCSLDTSKVPSCASAPNGCLASVCEPKSGTCAPKATNWLCNDWNECTLDTCAGPQCLFSPVADGTPCGETTVCKAGKCSAP